MIRKYTSADEIFEMTMQKIAPLPCQEAYARRLASMEQLTISVSS